MNQEAYRSIDVDVFKEILENEFFHNVANENADILSLVKKLSTVELRFQGLEFDSKKETSKIKFKQYGFQAKADFKLQIKQDVFENETILTLIPQNVYILEDVVKKMPMPYCDNGKKLSLLLGDSFERLKVKSKNILQNSNSDDQIKHYAKKNIQVALRNCYEARLLLAKIQKTKNRKAIFLAFMANVFMLNVLSYLLKMFSSYYKDKTNEKDKQKAELYNVMDYNVIMEPEVEYKIKQKIEEDITPKDTPKIKWNLQANQLLTAIYDLQHLVNDENNPIIEADMKVLQEIISNVFLDKKGNPINKLTVKTCLSESRSDKRAQGNKRIDVKKYFDL